MMLNDLEDLPNKTNWASLVRNLLMSLGFYEVWLYHGVGNINIFLSQMKQRLNDTFIQNWHERLSNSTRPIFYKTFASFQFQPYLSKLNFFKYIQATNRLRVSLHRLAIESGRWTRANRIPVDERKCNKCGVLENEYHFVTECKLYSDLRIKYMPKYNWKRSSMIKSVELLNFNNVNHLRKLGIFTYHAFNLRTELMYRNLFKYLNNWYSYINNVMLIYGS